MAVAGLGAMSTGDRMPMIVLARAASSSLRNVKVRPRAAAVLAAAVLIAGCNGDTLDPGTDIVTGPVLTLAPQTVAVQIGPERQLELGAGLRVTVSASTAAGSQAVVRLGATVLVLGPHDQVLDVALIGEAAIDEAQAGTVTREFMLRPSSLHVDAGRLPDTVRYEIHGWAYSAGGACAAAVKPAGQRLPCVRQDDGPTIAHGERGTPIVMTITSPHTVAFNADIPDRVEPHELMTFVVTAATRAELGPLQQVGVSARVRSEAGPLVTLLLGQRTVNAVQAAETFQLTFQQLIDLLPAGYPLPAPPNRVLMIEASGWAVHATGACAAARAGSAEQLQCDDVSPAGHIAAASGAPVTVGGVEGRTVPLPAGMTEAGDLLVHAGTQRLFASNTTGNTVEVLGTDNFAAGFVSRVPVGSRPWGLALNRGGDTLIVANSGGANVSFMAAASLVEDRARRFEIPRVTLYDYIHDDDGILLDFHNFADLPQYVAQDVDGRLLYSALSTNAAPIGTVRLAEWRPTWRSWEARLLFPCCLLSTNQLPTNRAITPSDDGTAIANIDSMSVVMVQSGPYVGPTLDVIIWDHVPGTLPGEPGRLIQTPALPIHDAIMHAYNAGSDLIAYPRHQWNVPESVAAAERTAVAASGDGRWVLFGEWPAAQPGRLMIWSAADEALNRVEDIQDMLNNSSDRISAVALNQDGSLGAARGDEGVYFFDTALRLRGIGGTALAGGRGLSFMPGNPPLQQQYAFVGTGRATIQVIEPMHFRVVGEVSIRSNVTGALRAAPCAPDAPIGCVATIYATTADGIVAVHVQQTHLAQ
jgi:hypothetical protein